MELGELLRFSGLSAKADCSPEYWDANISNITADSREVNEGSLFVAMPPYGNDGEEYLPNALERGAAAYLVHSEQALQMVKDLGRPVLRFDQGEPFETALAAIARAFYGDPSMNLKMIAVTGTNGKSTCCWWLRQALEWLGERSAYLGTLGIGFGDKLKPAANTTPFSLQLAKTVAQLSAEGAEALCMEVSSHALAQHRVDSLSFDLLGFTNLTPEHLDFHGTMDEYCAAKSRLFSEPRLHKSNCKGAIMMGSEYSQRVMAKSKVPTVAVNIGDGPEFVAIPLQVDVSAVEAELQFEGEKALLNLPIGGMINLENAALCAALLCQYGFALKDACAALNTVKPAPGRFESVVLPRGVTVVVDYAHTSDAISKLLRSVREVSRGKVILVFGCGGERDSSKRGPMMRAGLEGADHVVVTTDNPRNEPLDSILSDMLGDVEKEDSFNVIRDRQDAVKWALELAKEGDVVVMAGKGHEPYQMIGTEKLPWSEWGAVEAAEKEICE
jgi:UDP-N-acetylmuramoyl-L-alanyl-D-glutamate--2,6-diaminopimelate ligase